MKHYSSSIQALTHTERRVSRIEMDPQNFSFRDIFVSIQCRQEAHFNDVVSTIIVTNSNTNNN
jgi:hypothetical protein